MKLIASKTLLLFAAVQAIAALPGYGSGGGQHNSYCDGLIVRLNALGANLDAKVCLGNSGKSRYTADEITRLSCDGLVVAAKALGIKVRAGLCVNGGHDGSGNSGYNGGGNGGHNGGGNGGGNGGHNGGGNGGHNGGGNGGHNGGGNGGHNGGGNGGGNGGHNGGGNGGGRPDTCNGIVAKLQALGIKIDAKICLGGGGGGGGNGGNGGNSHPPLKGGNTCPDLVADLKLLGIPVKAEICLGGGGGGGGSSHGGGGGGNGGGGNGSSGNGGCAIGANVDVTRLIGVDLCVGGGGGGSGHHGGGNGGGNAGNNGNGSRPTCQDISAKVRLLGIKVDANICLRGPNAGPRAPVLSNAPGCPTLVANAKLLGIADVNVELCLKARVNLGVGGRSIARRAALAL
ncbi:hypothetical protein K493DRAFT_297024 [Basidiobolus meristosporus CBS 931.73]|uniref:Uncharacterized protein n=1 Tax=Basidiobolus meristosporus CBS 931.73 TaxID=1314790 RepID=A0A1Y1Z286_9FUNG|nr:hypothetical protein K493DRAFT_297024 [Basidiobolus meristosporus CBS 931.73]|eukprot:ORY04319.1 hypothetical protein K493DRAFT_297024 [Basidiobolus meristosporus CBS 931.73]